MGFFFHSAHERSYSNKSINKRTRGTIYIFFLFDLLIITFINFFNYPTAQAVRRYRLLFFACFKSLTSFYYLITSTTTTFIIIIIISIYYILHLYLSLHHSSFSTDIKLSISLSGMQRWCISIRVGDIKRKAFAGIYWYSLMVESWVIIYSLPFILLIEFQKPQRIFSSNLFLFFFQFSSI